MKIVAPKLDDCRDHGPASELFVVEGDSAARSLARVRDATFQAILPVQGKPMNALRAGRHRIEQNLQFKMLIRTLGVKLVDFLASAPVPPTVDSKPEQGLLFELDSQPPLSETVPATRQADDAMRYGKVILLFDPDADGIHGRTLMLLFFYRWLRPLLDAGRIFDVHVPQWVVTAQGLDAPVYATTPDYLKRVREELQRRGMTQIVSQRFRGLGSVPPAILRQTCVELTTRKLIRLTADHAHNAMALLECSL